jgi:hypothetical protein
MLLGGKHGGTIDQACGGQEHLMLAASLQLLQGGCLAPQTVSGGLSEQGRNNFRS